MKIEKTVDRGSKEKLYVQIYSIFLEKIENGEWPAGGQIPAEDELCKIYDVSKVTVREAIQELVREGYLRRLQGKGTFVMMSEPQSGIVMRTRLSEDIFGEEVKAEKEILERGFLGVAEDIRKILVNEGEIYYILCKKIVNEESYREEFFIPQSILPDIESDDLTLGSLYDLIEDKGSKKIFKVIQTVEATKIAGDAPAPSGRDTVWGLLVSRTIFSSEGIPIAYSRLSGTGLKQKFQMEFERIK
ncbi:MAG TPA: GntR family transcriptional regulator [Thermodesulfovibrionales bacterium]|nr:GntR family transcriptional regulator [Thermodesulfovibrionales bacterium]